VERLRLRYKKLKLKLDYLDFELFEVKQIFEDAKKDFEKALLKVVKKFPEIDPKQYSKENIKKQYDKHQREIHGKNEKRLAAPEQMKKLYKDIALETHPDRLIYCSSKIVEKKTELFNRARLAMEERDYYSLQQIADELGIENKNIDEESVCFLNDSIKSRKKQIEDIEFTVAWTWYHEDDPETKELIIANYANRISGNL
tara:strand:+ start:193 stop:792 length:600 start_codon:yes stop_codon:yes gene_type:complete